MVDIVSVTSKATKYFYLFLLYLNICINFKKYDQKLRAL